MSMTLDQPSEEVVLGEDDFLAQWAQELKRNVQPHCKWKKTNLEMPGRESLGHKLLDEITNSN